MSEISERVRILFQGFVEKKYANVATETRKEIIYHLAKHGPLNLTQLAELMKVSPPTLIDHLRILKNAGVVEHYAIPEKRRMKFYKLRIVPLTSDEVEKSTKIVDKHVKPLCELLEKAYIKILEEIRDKNVLKLMQKNKITYDSDEVREAVLGLIFSEIKSYLEKKGLIPSSKKPFLLTIIEEKIKG